MRVVHKVRTGKGKRWLKGQSSSSNPASKKHRDQAKNRFFCYDNKGKGNLTQNALQQHNALQNEENEPIDQEHENLDAQSVGGVSYKTFASNWSDCTNPCFSRLLKSWESGSELHKEMLAILAAVTEVIKSKDGKETETEYFAALMTTLSTVETPESLSAVLSLLHLTLKRLPKTVMRLKFSEMSKEFLLVLENPDYVDNGMLLRPLIGCLAQLLKAQELAVWSLSSTIQSFQPILGYIIHNRPKVRKTAHHAVCSILKGSDILNSENPLKNKDQHPAASTVAKFCIDKIEKSGHKDTTTILHVLQLLKEVLITFPLPLLKSSCETILKVMVLGTSVVKSCCLQAFHGMFMSNTGSGNISSELNAQIINALYDFQPGVNDVQPLIAWLTVMKEAHLSLNRLDHSLFVGHFPRLFSASVQCLLCEKPEVHPVVTDCLKILLVDCFKSVACLENYSLSNKMPSLITSLLKTLENGLKYQYHMTWNYVLQLIASLFNVFGKKYYQMMGKILLSLADLRDSYKFSFTSDLDYAIGMAVKSMGPKNVLSIIPLQLESDESLQANFPRSWLIPVLRSNIQETELAFFSSYFVPLARNLFLKSEKKRSEDKLGESKTLDLLQSQVWALLPGFCNKPTDIKDSFKGLARLLGTLLNDRPDLRITVLSSLRSLIKSSSSSEEDNTEIGKYAKNYLPIFFNLYTSPSSKKGSVEEGVRLAVYDTLKVYLTVTNKGLIENMFDKAMLKEDEELDNFTRHAVMDLMRAMLSYLDEERILKLYNTVTPYLTDSDITVQKKSYRVLEELCGTDSESCQKFLLAHIDLIQSTLVVTLSDTVSSSKAPRLRCLQHIMKKLNFENLNFIEAVIPEVILCTKHGSEKSKQAAFSLLEEIGKTMLNWKHKPSNEILKDLVKYVLAGLAGSPQMVSSSILALGTILHIFKEHVDNALLDLLIKNMCILMTSRSREIVKSSLSFIKILFSVLTEVQLNMYLETLMEGLLNMTDDARQHFRIKVKEILDRLVRKFGYDVIVKMIPEKYEKVLKNIKKLQVRKARKREEKADDENPGVGPSHKASAEIDDILQDSDMENENEAKMNTKVKNVAWIQEAADSDIVDFLDSKTSKNVSTTNPLRTKLKAKNETNFKVATDGRWIITDDMEGNMDDNNTKRRKVGKRKFSESVDDYEDDDNDSNGPKYETGGHGIHRNLAKSLKVEMPQETYRAKKAGGDIKKEGKFDPYMYVPLNRQSLNKRKQKKYKGHLKNILDGAKKGAVKGKKGFKKSRN